MVGSSLGTFLLLNLFLLARLNSCNGRQVHVRGAKLNSVQDDKSVPGLIARPQNKAEVKQNKASEVGQVLGPPRVLINIFAQRRKEKKLRQRLRRQEARENQRKREQERREKAREREQQQQVEPSNRAGTSSKKDDMPIEQNSRINVNRYISCLATAYAGAHHTANVKISVPSEARVGDMLLIVVGGSASGKARPGVPSPSAGVEEIESVGPTDVNLKAYYKVVTSSTIGQKFTISGGKNSYVAISVFRGVDTNNPVYRYGALHNSMDGREGDAKAPSVSTVRNGAVVAAYLYDDPHIARIKNKGSSMLTSFRDGDDGMAIGVMPTNGDKSGAIYAVGRGWRRGGGNDVTMSISLRPKV